jgi:hypothetical protein
MSHPREKRMRSIAYRADIGETSAYASATERRSRIISAAG